MPIPAEVAAVSFDVGGTLIEPRPSVGRIYAEVAAGLGANGLDVFRLAVRFRAVWAALVAHVFDGVHPIGRSPKFFDRFYAHFATPAPWRVLSRGPPRTGGVAATRAEAGDNFELGRPVARPAGRWFKLPFAGQNRPARFNQAEFEDRTCLPTATNRRHYPRITATR